MVVAITLERSRHRVGEPNWYEVSRIKDPRLPKNHLPHGSCRRAGSSTGNPNAGHYEEICACELSRVFNLIGGQQYLRAIGLCALDLHVEFPLSPRTLQVIWVVPRDICCLITRPSPSHSARLQCRASLFEGQWVDEG